MTLAALNRILAEGRDLSEVEATSLMSGLFAEEEPEAAKGAALAFLRSKGATGTELAALVRSMKQLSGLSNKPQMVGLLDTCGTGGGSPSFNLSTAAALIAAGAGVKIAKHGNRAVTSQCGSADVLEALGVSLNPAPTVLAHSLNQAGIAFLFAPAHHPAMKRVSSIRSQLGFRTVFNQLGPLANPFAASLQLLGVYDPNFLMPMAEAARELGVLSALVVHGTDQLDEISPSAPTEAVWLKNGELVELKLFPASFGLEAVPAGALEPASTVSEAALIVLEAISEPDSLRCAAVLPNAAAALVLAGLCDDWKAGAELARETVANGRAREALAKLIQATNET